MRRIKRNGHGGKIELAPDDAAACDEQGKHHQRNRSDVLAEQGDDDRTAANRNGRWNIGADPVDHWSHDERTDHTAQIQQHATEGSLAGGNSRVHEDRRRPAHEKIGDHEHREQADP